MFKIKKLTKEERKEKERIYKEKSKFDSSSRKMFIIILSFFGLLILNNLIMFLSEDYAFFYTRYIYNFKQGALYNLISYIPYGHFVLMVVMIIISLIISFISDYYSTSEKYSIEVANKKYNKFLKLDFIMLVLFVVLFITPTFNNVHIPNFENILFKEYNEKIYTKEDLIKLNLYLKNKVNFYANGLARNENNDVVFNKDYQEVAVNSLRNISNDITLLKGLYPAKSYEINDTIRGIVGNDTVGLTFGYSTFFDLKSDPTLILNTIMHEYCHTKTINRENEAVFCSFLAGIKSDDPVVKYSAYLEAFYRVNNALADIDYKEAIKIVGDVDARCLLKEQTEFCVAHAKNTKEYINDAFELNIKTYVLKYYKDYKDEIKESLEILKKEKAEFKTHDKKVSIDDIMKLIDEEFDENVLIKLKINKKIYNKVKKALSNNNLYASVAQVNYEREESKDKKDDVVSYYLAPFKHEDTIFINGTIGSINYDYARVARLLLEYYDKNGYN